MYDLFLLTVPAGKNDTLYKQEDAEHAANCDVGPPSIFKAQRRNDILDGGK